MSDWRPIETAPRDGTPIIGALFQRIADEVVTHAASMQWEGGPGRVLYGMWTYTGIVVCPVEDELQPTHWIPMPEPPAN